MTCDLTCLRIEYFRTKTLIIKQSLVNGLSLLTKHSILAPVIYFKIIKIYSSQLVLHQLFNK